MSHSRAPLLASAVFCLFALIATLIPSLGRAQTAAHVVISEVMYDPSGTEPDGEWIELFNPTGETVDLAGWILRDNSTSQDALPALILGPGEYSVVAAKLAAFKASYPGFAGNLMSLEQAIGNGLANGGDRVILKDANGADVDALSYGTDTTYFNVQRSGNLEGHSLARVPPAVDTDTAADWSDQYPPNPGGPGSAPTPTATQTSTLTSTPTASNTPTITPGETATAASTSTTAPTGTSLPTPTPNETATATSTSAAAATATDEPVTPTATSTPTPTSTALPGITDTPTPTLTATITSTPVPTPTAGPAPVVRLNEILPWPDAVDWDGNGQADAYDAWIEITNLGPGGVDLGGWALDDILGGGSRAYVFPPGTLLQSGGFLVHCRSITGVALNQDADTAHLLAPDGSVADSFSYANPGRDASYSRAADGAGDWTAAYPPSPGDPNLPGAPTPTGTSTPTGTPTATPTATATATETPSPTSTATWTLTPTPTPAATATPSTTPTATTATQTPTVTPTPSATPSTAQPGDVVINEIMQNPKTVADTTGEWFEVYNATGHAIDLNGWMLEDTGTEHHRIQNSGPLWLPADGYLVLGRNADPTRNGAVSVAYQYGGFTLGNTDDEIILLDGAGTEIDRVAYDGGPGFPNPDGAAMQLIQPDLDNALGANWRIAPDPWPGGAGDRGSPGAANPAILPTSTATSTTTPTATVSPTPTATTPATPIETPSPTSTATWTSTTTPMPSATATPTQTATLTHTPTPTPSATSTATATQTPTATATPSATPSMAQPGDVVINEIMQNPKTVADTTGEWFEIYNAANQAVDLNGWTITDAGTDRHRVQTPNGEPLWLPAGGYLVLGRNAHPTLNGGVGVNYQYSNFVLGNTDDTIILLDALGTEIDRVAYTGGSVFPNPDGASMMLIQPDLDNALGANWRIAPDPWPGSAGDRGSPGAPNPNAPPEPTATRTATVTATATLTLTAVAPTAIPTATPTWTTTPAPTPSASATASATPSATPTTTVTSFRTPTATRTPTPSRTPTVTRTPSSTPTPTPTPSTAKPGDVVINEIMQNPLAVSDTNGEWFEIYNTSGYPIDLNGWKITDAGAEQHRIATHDPLWLPPDSYLVLGRNTDPSSNGGVGITYQYSNFTLGNTDDEIILLDGTGTEIDRVAYDGGPVFPNPDGASLQLIRPDLDNALGANWCISPNPWPGSAGDRGSPGAANPAILPTSTATSTTTPTATVSPTPAATTPATPTQTPSSTSTATWTSTATPSATATPTQMTTLTHTPSPIPSATSTATATQTPTAASTPSATPSMAQPGDVVINEIMQNPKTVSDTTGEWFEIYNTENRAVDLNGWTIADAGTDRHRIQTPNGEPLWLPAGGYLVLGRNADSSSNGGVLIAYRYAGFTLGNADDEIILLDGAGTEIDRVAYDGGPAFPNPDGASMMLIRPDLDNANGANWRISPDPWPGSAGDRGSPGTANPSILPTSTATWTTTATPTPAATATATLVSTAAATPTETPSPMSTAAGTATATPMPTPSTAQRGAVVINEILQNPAAVADTAGEWFEVHNPTDHAVDLNGWTIADAGTDNHRIQTPNGDPLWLPAGGYLVLGRNADASTNGGVLVAYRYAGFTLGNTDDEIILLDSAGTEIDRVAYDGGPSFPDPDGASMQLIRPDLDNSSGANWRISSDPWPGSAGDHGSPGTPNHTARIEGYVYEDRNGNRAREADEPGIADVVVSLTNGRTTRSIASGWYGFADLPPGIYEVSETQPDGYTSTTPDRRTVTVALGSLAFGPSFGEQRLPPTATPTAGPSPTPTPSHWPRLLLSEVLYDAPQGGSDSAYEWIEIFNPSEVVISLAGWAVSDNGGQDLLPATNLDPGEYLVVAATAAGFRTNHLDFAGKLLSLEGSIGNGLSNTGDVVRLLAPDGTIVDAMSYGENTTAFAPACPGVPAGRSLARVPSWSDTDAAADWTPQANPNPGSPGVASQLTPTPTPTSTALPGSTATPTPTATLTFTPMPTPTTGPASIVRLNEILPRPDAVDWNGDGEADAYDEWIEIVNLDPGVVDLGGWALDDIAGGSAPYVFPPGTLLAPGEFLVRYRSATGVALNQDADTARLLAPDGREVDAFSYRNPGRDASYSRTVDGTGDWTDSYPPSPGGPNLPGAPTVTATPSRTRTPTPTRTPTATAVPSRTPTAVAYDRTALRLNEVLPAPSEIDWNGDGTANTNDEWIEVYNRGSAAIDLGGWLLDDIAAGGSAPYVIPNGILLQPGGFLVLFRDRTGVTLNNDGDTVRLLGPDAAEVDSFTYAKAKSDSSYSRSTDGDGAWTDTYPPSPGQANIAPTPTPTPTASPTSTPFPAGVTLNEILPDPQRVDWDQDGAVYFADEWIELHNGSPVPAALGGWALMDDTKAYTLPLGLTIWPQSYLLLYRRETGLSLSDWRDRVTLVRPDGSTADQFAYDRGPGADRSFCRSTDGSGAWTTECEVTPGQANRLIPRPPSGGGDSGAALAQPTRGPRTYTIAAARAAPDDTRVTVTGAVTLPPGLYGRNIYLQDATGGIKVYLRSGGYPALAAGDQVRVTGWTRQFHGEVELSVPGPSYLTRLGPGEPPHPVYVRTGQVGETHEGELILIAGRVVKFEPQGLTLDDGTGPTRIFFPAELPWRRPYVNVGEFWAAQGVVGQYAFEAPWEGGYRVIPRFKTDVSDAPLVLPVTGGQ